ncbi:MAG: glycosyl transferase family protein, partial [Deltaproteobacteria bacterium]
MPDTFDLVIRVFTVPVAVLFLLNGLDDLFVDLNFFILGLWRRRLALTVEKLKAVPQKRIAVLVPAWREAAVIEQMLENTISTLDYDPSRFDVFVGTYANDLETQACVDAVCARTPNVVKVVVPHDGPTCKADCLNWVYQGILLAEQRRGIRYDILMLHDSEDVVHPLELRLHNYHIPAYDFVQTPVLPLEVPWYSLFGGTYLDDFAETHLKDMVVRARIGGLVPSAGVGSGFARDAFEEISVASKQEAFDPNSLTEDYEIGLKFRLAGKKTLFAAESITRSRIETDSRGRERRRERQEYIATREFFPTSFAATVKQRSRWILGIEFQSWEKIGWKGSLPVLYCLWRDRKAMLSHVGNMIGYIIVLYSLSRLAIGGITGHPWSFSYIFPLGSFLWWALMANLVLLAWRWAMRFVTVQKIYGALHGFVSLLRMPIGNVINFTALLRATSQWIHHKATGEPLRWASTAHEFPTTNALSAFRERLGDLLVDREGLSREELARALELQERTGEQLGEVLTLSGVMTGWQLVRALGAQWSIPVVDPDPGLAPLSLLARLPESEADELNVLPASLGEDGIATVIAARPLQMEEKARLEARLGARIRVACAPEAAIRHARARAYRRDPGEHAQRLGERLVALGILTPEALARALEGQRESHELLGELLVREGLVKAEEIARAGEGMLHGGFRAVKPDDGDPDLLMAIGYGFCVLHTLVPLRCEAVGALEVASAY